MNIKNILMDTSLDKDENLVTKTQDDPKSHIKSNLSTSSVLLSEGSLPFWSTNVKTSMPSNVFLPPIRSMTSMEVNHMTESSNSTSLSNFVDLSSDQNMICPLCKKIFRFEKNLLRHMQKTHATGEAESVLKCKLCNYTTRHYSNMYVHIRTHTGDKPYSCSGCGASFTQGSSLKLHIKSRHEDNTSLFSLTKKPGKNNLTKLWTRVYKKDLTKFSTYALGNYIHPFNVSNFTSPTTNHDLLLPFGNFLPYPRLSPLPYMSNCSSQIRNINHHNLHNFPMLLNRLPFIPFQNQSEKMETSDNNNTKIDNKGISNDSPSFRSKKAILSISDFVEDNHHPLSTSLQKDEENKNSFKSSLKDNMLLIGKDQADPSSQHNFNDKDEENNSEIFSVIDFDLEESLDKSGLFNDTMSDALKSWLCDPQNPQNIDQMLKIFQSINPAIIQKLKPLFANKLLNVNKINCLQQKLTQAPFANGFSDFRQIETKFQYSSNNVNNNNNNNISNNNNNTTNNNILPHCMPRNSNIFPFSIKPPFHSLLSQTPDQSSVTQSCRELFNKIGQISDKSLFHFQAQGPTKHQPPLSSMLSPSNMIGLVGYQQPLMKVMDKAINQFLQ